MNPNASNVAEKEKWLSASWEKKLQALSLAVAAFQVSEAAVEEMQRNPCFERNPFLYRALMTGAVVSYARAFYGNDGVLKLPPDFIEFPRRELEEQHKELMLARRKLYGHTDVNYADKWAVDPKPFKTRISFRKTTSGKTEIVPVVEAPDISPATLPLIGELVEFQLRRVQQEMRKTLNGMAKSRSYSFDKNMRQAKTSLRDNR